MSFCYGFGEAWILCDSEKLYEGKSDISVCFECSQQNQEDDRVIRFLADDRRAIAFWLDVV